MICSYFTLADEDDKLSHRQQKRAKKRKHKAEEEAMEEAKRIKLSEKSIGNIFKKKI